MTPSQRKAINKSKTMRLLHIAQRNGEAVVKKLVKENTVMNWVEAQMQTSTTAYSWVVTPRGRIVSETMQVMK